VVSHQVGGGVGSLVVGGRVGGSCVAGGLSTVDSLWADD